MAPATPSSRERLVSAGLELASAQGLSVITLSSLSERAQLSKSGIFAHFASKEDLQLAILDETGAAGHRHIVAPAESVAPGVARLAAVICRWFGWAARSGLPGGCPAAAGMFEYDDRASVVRDKLRQMDTEWRSYLASLAQEAVATGEFRGDADTGQFVWELFGIYLAHHTSHRFARLPEANRHAEIALQALLSRYLADPRALPPIAIKTFPA